MSENERPIAVIYEIGTDICKWSGKKAEGGRMTIANSPVQNTFLSWTTMKKMLAFSMPATVDMKKIMDDTYGRTGGGKK